MKSAPTTSVGRESELDLLLDHARSATRTSGRVDLISGEPGIGKSTLVHAYTTRLKEEDLPVYIGRCVDGIAPPFWP